MGIILIMLMLNLAAGAVLLYRRQLPAAGVFPWKWAATLGGVIGLGSLGELAQPAKLVSYTTLLSVLILALQLRPARWLWRLLAWLAIGLAGLTVLEALGGLPGPAAALPGLLRRPFGLANPNLVADWLLLLPWGPWTILGGVATQSRGALAGLGLVGALRLPNKYRRYGLLLLAGMIGLLLVIRPPDRLRYWVEGAQLWLARPLNGWGIGSYQASLDDPGLEAAAMAAVAPRTGMPTAHNLILTMAAETGLAGLVPLAGLVLSLVQLVRRSSHPARWGLLAWLVQQLVDDQWHNPITAILLGVALALCLSKLTIDKSV